MSNGLRVAIVDDNDDMRMILSTIVTGAGHAIVAEATTGPEALELWDRLGPGAVDAWIMDQRMPGTEGLEVARTILAADADQRIVLVSAQLDDALRAEAVAIGVVAVMDKDDLFEVTEHLGA